MPTPAVLPPAWRPVVAVFALLTAWLAPLGAHAQAQAVPDPERGDVRLVVFGDFNGPYGSLTYPAPVSRVVDAIVHVWRPDGVLLPGDLVAGQDRSLPDERFPAMWAAFDAAVAATLRAAGIPYLATMGNHDASSLRDVSGGFAFAREREAAAAYWNRDEHRAGLVVVDADGPPFTLAIRLGPLFVASIDASGPVVDAEQRAWLAAALASEDAQAAAARIVMGHLPLVGIAVGRDRAGEVVWEAASLRDLMLAGDVDLYVSGHQAAYYPGRWEGLELLFAGGVGARALRVGDAPRRSAVTLVDVWLEPLRLRYTTLDPSGFVPHDPAALPASLDAFGGLIERSERDGSCALPGC